MREGCQDPSVSEGVCHCWGLMPSSNGWSQEMLVREKDQEEPGVGSGWLWKLKTPLPVRTPISCLTLSRAGAALLFHLLSLSHSLSYTKGLTTAHSFNLPRSGSSSSSPSSNKSIEQRPLLWLLHRIPHPDPAMELEKIRYTHGYNGYQSDAPFATSSPICGSMHTEGPLDRSYNSPKGGERGWVSRARSSLLCRAGGGLRTCCISRNFPLFFLLCASFIPCFFVCLLCVCCLYSFACFGFVVVVFFGFCHLITLGGASSTTVPDNGESMI